MPDLKQVTGFQPSLTSLKYICGTRKMSSNYGGVTLPGLFKTRAFPRDIALFSLVFILEIVGMKMIYDLGQFNPYAMIGVFLLEFTIAIFAHQPQSKVQILSNLLVLEYQGAQGDNHRAKRRSSKFLQAFLNSILILIAFFKAYLFIGLYGDLDGIALTVCVSYGLSAFLQISVTGYFLWEVFAIISIGRDYKIFRKGFQAGNSTDNKAKRQVSVFTFSIPIEEVPEDSSPSKHSLLKVDNHYELICNGLFSDEDLEHFVFMQKTDDQKRNLALQLLKVQLNFVNA
jgi:hypothetical protein